MLSQLIIHTFVVCLCGILSSTAQDLIIVSDFSPPAIYTSNFGKRLNFIQLNVDGGRRNITAPAMVEYDPVERRVYWTQWSSKWTEEGLIARCDLKGNFYQELIKDVDYAVGLALDVKGRRMYFSHEGMALESAKLDGSDRRTIVRELPTSGHYVFFDNIGQRVYWADSTKQVIESVRLDGRNRTVHVSGLSHPSDLFLEKGRRLYWTDFGSDTIATKDIKGEDVRTLYQYPLVSTDTHPNAIAVTLQNVIYWVDRNHPRLHTIPKNIREGQKVVPRDVGNVEFGWPSGLHIYQAGGSVNVRSASFAVYLFVPMLLQLLLKF